MTGKKMIQKETEKMHFNKFINKDNQHKQCRFRTGGLKKQTKQKNPNMNPV